MIRRAPIFAAIWLLLTAAAIAAWPGSGRIYPTGAVTCSDTSVHTITATGAGSVTVPSGCNHVTLKAWGGGGPGQGYTSTNFFGGPGGGFATYSSYSVTPGNTLYWSVAASTAGNSGISTAGAPSWMNISTNAQPSAIANGIVATGGLVGTLTVAGVGGSYGPSGATGYTGGNDSAGNHEGGGGAGSGGNGGNSTSSAGGVGGTPDGGAGGTYVSGTGASNPGVAPGGGGSAGGANPYLGGAGAAGQTSYQFSAFNDLPPANDNFSFAARAA